MVVTEDVQNQELEGLCDYELVVIVSPGAEEEGFEAAIESVSRFVTGRGGVVSEVERWGKRRLAYPIKRHSEGNYVLTRFRMSPEHNKELESNLRISEDVIRHLLIKLR
jgi:small subunit ribosomal protein S6